MKKQFLLLSLFSLIASSTIALAGCNNQETDKRVAVDYGTIKEVNIEDITDLPKLTYDELSSKITNKESFLLAIYGEETCGCWTDYRPVLTEFVNDTHANIDYISSYDFVGKENTFGLYLVAGDLPSLAVFERGTLKIQSVYLRDDRMMFKNYKSFKEFIDKNVALPKMYYISKNILDGYIAEDKEFNLYIARSACPDCSVLNREYLSNWSVKEKETRENLYILDLQPYLESGETIEVDGETITVYQHLKNIYGLSEKNNPTFGYSTGMVPTLQRRKGSTVLDMIVVLNDSVDRENKKVKSYFTAERVQNIKCLENATFETILDGMALTDEQVANWSNKDLEVTYKQEFHKKYHYPIVEAFLSAYVK